MEKTRSLYSCWIALAFAFGAGEPSHGAQEAIVTSIRDLVTRVNSSKPGDVITIKSGRYRDSNSHELHGMGQKGKPITVRGKGKVEFETDSPLRLRGRYTRFEGITFSGLRRRAILEINGENIRVTRCSFIESDPPADKRSYTYWVVIKGRKNRVDHCLFEGKNNGGAMIVFFGFSKDNPGDHLIDYNHFNDRKEGPHNGYETIKVGNSGMSHLEGRVTIENNLFEDCDGEIEIISLKTSRVVVRHNTILNCRGTITMRQCMGTEITDNYFLSDHKKDTGGIRIIGPHQTVRRNYFSGLSRHEVVTLRIGNFRFELGKLYEYEGKYSAFPRTPRGGVLNYGQVTEATIEDNFFESRPEQRCIAHNSGYKKGASNAFLNESTSLRRNIFYCPDKRSSSPFIQKAPGGVLREANHPKHTGDIVYTTATFPVPEGVERLPPRVAVKFILQTKNREYKIYRSVDLPDAGPQSPPLRAADVGPDGPESR